MDARICTADTWSSQELLLVNRSPEDQNAEIPILRIPLRTNQVRDPAGNCCSLNLPLNYSFNSRAIKGFEGPGGRNAHRWLWQQADSQ